jgi:hypothetical protein
MAGEGGLCRPEAYLQGRSPLYWHAKTCSPREATQEPVPTACTCRCYLVKLLFANGYVTGGSALPDPSAQ